MKALPSIVPQARLMRTKVRVAIECLLRAMYQTDTRDEMLMRAVLPNASRVSMIAS
jgi:hypothetical protein